jgi:hypothetical protein
VGISHSSELERAVVAALKTGYTALYGRQPLAARAWVDSDALLVVMRGSGVEPSELRLVDQLQRSIGASVYLRTGVMLRSCGHSSHPDRDLLVLAFERVGTDELDAHRGPEPRERLPDPS